MPHAAKEIRRTLILRLNQDDDLIALGLAFEDMVGRAIEDVARDMKRGFVGTHPEVSDPDTPEVRNLEVIILYVVGAADSKGAADHLDDAQEAIEAVIRREPTISGMVPGHITFQRAEQALDGSGRRDFGTRILTYRAAYATRED